MIFSVGDSTRCHVTPNKHLSHEPSRQHETERNAGEPGGQCQPNLKSGGTQEMGGMRRQVSSLATSTRVVCVR